MRAVLGSVPGEGLGIGDLARVGKEELSFCTPQPLAVGGGAAMNTWLAA